MMPADSSPLGVLLWRGEASLLLLWLKSRRPCALFSEPWSAVIPLRQPSQRPDAVLLAGCHRLLQERVGFWRGLGFNAADLRQLLAAAPRLLLYPMHERKYQAKLRFLQGGRGCTQLWGACLRDAAALPEGAPLSGLSWLLECLRLPKDCELVGLSRRH